MKYLILADVVDPGVQNVQDWTATWGEMRGEIEDLGGEIIDAHAVLGEHDFQFTCEIDDPETAVQVAVAIERHGLDTTTHQLIDADRLGSLVEDV